MVPRLDTVAGSKCLHSAGFEVPQAETIVKIDFDAQGQVATKADIQQLKGDINWLKLIAGIQIVVMIATATIVVSIFP